MYTWSVAGEKDRDSLIGDVWCNLIESRNAFIVATNRGRVDVLEHLLSGRDGREMIKWSNCICFRSAIVTKNVSVVNFLISVCDGKLLGEMLSAAVAGGDLNHVGCPIDFRAKYNNIWFCDDLQSAYQRRPGSHFVYP